MGRIKVFFCSFCLERSPERQTNEQSFSRGIDVSHLATPHNSYNLGPGIRSSANSTPVGENNNEENKNYSHQSKHRSEHYQKPSNSVVQNRATPECHDIIDDSPINTGHHQQPQQNDNNQPLPSPHSSSSASNIYDQSQISQQPNHDNVPAQLQNLQQESHQEPEQQQHEQPQQQQHQQLNNQKNLTSQNHGTSTKLSYEIISVREPLAKILAEQHRQILGDHEYIEVYGERGSSCFYEEIAGSTTSSATYDQIGAASNHNYQALINAYAVINRANESNRYNSDVNNHEHSNNHNAVDNGENIYNLEQANDRVDNFQSTSNPTPSTSYNMINNIKSNSPRQVLNDRNDMVSQSIPVYSVINKATRRSNAIIRATMESCRPPQPPPKNLPGHQSSSSAIQHYQESSVFMNNQCRSNSRNSPQIPSSSSAANNIDDSKDNPSESGEAKDKHSMLPQPPPRYSKQPLFDATRRPLPNPDNCEISNKNDSNNALNQGGDLESLNNGYELLNTNFDEDQIDVGYEKIRDSHQYSGGSLSSHFNPLQLKDNGGYESVQPIYSSPSNALAEPNYEAIGPATASELAAAATARLNAVIDFLKQDQ